MGSVGFGVQIWSGSLALSPSTPGWAGTSRDSIQRLRRACVAPVTQLSPAGWPERIRQQREGRYSCECLCEHHLCQTGTTGRCRHSLPQLPLPPPGEGFSPEQNSSLRAAVAQPGSSRGCRAARCGRRTSPPAAHLVRPQLPRSLCSLGRVRVSLAASRRSPILLGELAGAGRGAGQGRMALQEVLPAKAAASAAEPCPGQAWQEADGQLRAVLREPGSSGTASSAFPAGIPLDEVTPPLVAVASLGVAPPLPRALSHGPAMERGGHREPGHGWHQRHGGPQRGPREGSAAGRQHRGLGSAEGLGRGWKRGAQWGLFPAPRSGHPCSRSAPLLPSLCLSFSIWIT